MSSPEVTSDTASANFHKALGILSTHKYSITPEEINQYVDQDVNGVDINKKNTLENVFTDNARQYIDDTFNGVLLNNVANTSNYLRKNLAHELERTQNIHTQIVNQIGKSRLSAMESEYTLHYNYFISRIMRLTILLITILFICAALLIKGINFGLTITFMIIVFVAYIIIVIIMLRKNMSRRSDDWDKFNFNAPVKKNKKTKN